MNVVSVKMASAPDPMAFTDATFYEKIRNVLSNAKDREKRIFKEKIRLLEAGGDLEPGDFNKCPLPAAPEEEEEEGTVSPPEPVAGTSRGIPTTPTAPKRKKSGSSLTPKSPFQKRILKRKRSQGRIDRELIC